MVFKLRSPAIAPSGHIPAKYTCDGSDLSPPLRWTDPPLNTKSFALIVDNHDASGGATVHWLLYGVAGSPLSVNMGETVTPWEFSVEGESGSESDERIGAGPRASDRGGGEGDAAAVHGGVQTEDRPGGRRLQDAGRDRGVAAA